jgi:hypothetical protein
MTTEHNAKTPHTATGIFATLRGLLRVQGAGASSHARLAVAFLLTAVAALAFSAAPALAAAPSVLSESTSPTAKPSEEARLEATVNAGEEAAPETTECHFQYGETSVSEHTVACEQGTPPGTLEGGEQGVAVTVNGLKAGTTYDYLVVLKNASGKKEGKEERVTTLPVPATEVPSLISSTTATFKGTLTPLNSTVPAEYFFVYNVGKEIVCTGERRTEPTESAGTGSGFVKVSTAVVGLQPNQKYSVCLLSTNTLGDSEGGLTPKYFETPPAPPTIVSQSASHHNSSGQPLSPGEARLEGIVNPNNQLTECHFQYGEASVEEHEVPCEPEVLRGYGEDGVAAIVGGLSGQPYHYQIVAKNGKGETAPVVEETVIPPQTPTTQAASPVAAKTAMLHAVLNPGEALSEAGSYEFLYNASAGECQHGSATPTTGTSGKKEPVEAELTGLLPNTTYTFCLLARNKVEETAVGSPVTFTTETSAPAPGAESFSNVGSSSATLNAQVEPGGAPTTYFFEYATEAEYAANNTYSSRTPAASAGAGSQPVGVLAHLEGLTADTAYHFRVMVENAKVTSPVPGVDTTFSTFPTGTLGLPDDRGYELVSPLNHGTPLVLPGTPTRAAADGSAVAYVGTAPPAGGNGSSGGGGGQRPTGTNVFLAERSGTGWDATDIEPADVGSATIEFPLYEGFSSDLSIGFLSSPEALGEGAPVGQGIYSRDSADGRFDPIAAGARYDGSTPDGSYALVSREGKLEEVETATGKSYLISVLPDGQPYTPSGGEPAAKATFGSAEGDLERVISNDGTRVIWTVAEAVNVYEGFDTKALYVRENATMPQSPLGEHDECLVTTDACTVQLDVATAPTGTGAKEIKEREEKSGGGVFQTASVAGSKVFFTDCHRLTANSTAVETGAAAPTCSTYGINESPQKIMPAGTDLYEYDLDSGTLTDLTPTTSLTSGSSTPNEHADVAGVLGVSEDGSYIYFAAAGALGSGASPTLCEPLALAEEANAGSVVPKDLRDRAKDCNMYVIHAGEQPRLIATLAQSDGFGGNGPSNATTFHNYGDWFPERGVHLAQVSPDGRHLVFVSLEDLSGFESESNREIYMYDLETGHTSCVSCNPSGTPAILESLSPGYDGQHPAELPTSSSPTYALRDLSAGGDRVFFESTEALVPDVADAGVSGFQGASEAGKGLTNVYEWERDGSGSCARTQGCLYLLSGGTSSDLSYFVDASEEGEDVFIGSRADLVPQDKGEAYEIYDVRVGATPPPAEPECTGSGCQGVPPAPPLFSTPASVTITGTDDLEPPPPPKTVTTKTVKCNKGATKNNKGKCIRKKKKRAKKASKASRATNDREGRR